MKSEAVNKVLLMVVLVFVALALPLGLVVFGGRKMWQEYTAKPLPVETSAALRASVERSANAVFPAPTLGEDVLTVESTVAKFEEEVTRITRLAHEVGGTASLWKGETRTRVLASVPVSGEDVFREAVRHGTKDMVIAGAPKPTTVVEVVVQVKKEED